MLGHQRLESSLLCVAAGLDAANVATLLDSAQATATTPAPALALALALAFARYASFRRDPRTLLRDPGPPRPLGFGV